MNKERLQIWVDALEDAKRKRRAFDIDVWVKGDTSKPCGFAACAAGDLALYPPAQALGFSVLDLDLMETQICFGGRYGSSAVAAFLEIWEGVSGVGDRAWLVDTIVDSYNTYGPKTATRQQVIKRLKAKLATL